MLASRPLATAAAPRRHPQLAARRPPAPRSRPPAASATDAPAAGGAPAPPGRRYEVTLPKPVGVVFSQKPGGPVFIEEVVAGGNADKAGLKPGDVLSSCSAYTLKAGKEGRYEREGYGDRPYDNWERVDIECEGLEFKTVMAALKSNNDRRVALLWGIKTVTLVVRRVEEGDE
ncbi:hypothetical protein Rsub_03489 [Raphidocelis subcapitata]|uniref:PDZ domain-containing protein n=1 Tax=Raphidocelis subcapitata TaxID=307507 RepID=A0A2V0NY51_9CHLO|nr:hypothetical protein Rsub_03489 [Raphidocelis subcapitata]|eukprot:GBF90493.1 hypothetical protein Rsub_03489 [Raphidocelis subcapitata]